MMHCRPGLSKGWSVGGQAHNHDPWDKKFCFRTSSSGVKSPGCHNCCLHRARTWGCTATHPATEFLIQDPCWDAFWWQCKLWSAHRDKYHCCSHHQRRWVEKKGLSHQSSGCRARNSAAQICPVNLNGLDSPALSRSLFSPQQDQHSDIWKKQKTVHFDNEIVIKCSAYILSFFVQQLTGDYFNTSRSVVFFPCRRSQRSQQHCAPSCISNQFMNNDVGAC